MNSQGCRHVRWSEAGKKKIVEAKLLQKSEMRKDIVIELSYRGFSRASDYS